MLEVAAMSLLSKKWPLMIDPDGVGKQWLEYVYKKGGIKEISIEGDWLP